MKILINELLFFNYCKLVSELWNIENDKHNVPSHFHELYHEQSRCARLVGRVEVMSACGNYSWQIGTVLDR